MVNGKITGIILNYKGWFNLYSLPGEVDVSLSDDNFASVSFDAASLKWLIKSEVLDEKGKVETVFDPEQQMEVPIIRDFLFGGKLEGKLSIDFMLDRDIGSMKSELHALPTDCTCAGYTTEFAAVNQSRRNKSHR